MTLVDSEARSALRARLERGDRLAGCSLDYPSVRLAFDLAPGFDILFIDCEHGGPGVETVQALVAAARACRRPALLRPWCKDPGLARRFLDCGVEGLIWPDIETAEELDALQRSLDAAGHADAVLIALIETRQAVEDLDRILAHPRLDGILIGPGDLAASFGLGRGTRDAGQAALQRDILARAAARGVAAGGPVSALGADALESAGATLWMHAAAGLLRAGMSAATVSPAP